MTIKQSSGAIVPSEFEIGKYESLELAVYDESGQEITGETVNYSSSNTNVATFDGSTVTFHAVGSTTITAVCDGYEQAQIGITIKEQSEPESPFDWTLNEFNDDMGLGNNIRSQVSDFNTNTEYTFTIDFSVWQSFRTTPNKLKIMGNPAGDFQIVDSITSISIWFDNEKWVEGTDYEIVEDATTGYSYVDWSKTTSEIKSDSTLTGRFKVSEDVGNACLLTHYEE